MFEIVLTFKENHAHALFLLMNSCGKQFRIECARHAMEKLRFFRKSIEHFRENTGHTYGWRRNNFLSNVSNLAAFQETC